ncbi:MAG TPA: 50S ribosomal protein L6 [Candidatus Desulfofervidus auxilii]|uniref:Large ribosomal subunit protein uL6 n=1 Tax=Desulfofervidus auxilii TaxID=1621989 RepID=A0A7C0Y446_DESA2|nr:50S ribosomal protein L6 [Candidatus Desulfofervidus auxilii]
MSRIGKKPIVIPENVKVIINNGEIQVKGPKGELKRNIVPGIKVEKEGNVLKVMRENDTKKLKALHGLMRQLIANMVVGVTEGFKKTLVVEGLGYKADLKGKKLILSLGFSHPVEYEPPSDIKLAVDGNKIIVEGIDKEQVGQVAAIIRRFKPPEPYKGKGIRYIDEQVRRKAGKAGGK